MFSFRSKSIQQMIYQYKYITDDLQSFLSVWTQAIDLAAVSKTNRKTEQRGPRDRNGEEIAEAIEHEHTTPSGPPLQPFPGAQLFGERA
jgi:hypothetical protein